MSSDTLYRPIIGRNSAQKDDLSEEEPAECEPEEMEDQSTSISVLVYFLIAIFGISSHLATTAIWIELPVLGLAVPEGKAMSLYLLALLEVCSIVTLAYLLARKGCHGRLDETPFIYSGLILSLTALILMGLFWGYTIEIYSHRHSFVFLISSFLASVVSSVTVVTYLPFTARFREQYITAVHVGEVFGAFIPHLTGFAQGLGRTPECLGKQTNTSNSSSDTRLRRSIYSHFSTTTPAAIPPPELRFSESFFFYIMAGFVALSALCFMLLRCCQKCQREYEETSIEGIDDLELTSGSATRRDDPDNTEVWLSSCDGATYILDDGSIRQSAFRKEPSETIQDHKPCTYEPSTSNISSTVRPPAFFPDSVDTTQDYRSPSYPPSTSNISFNFRQSPLARGRRDPSHAHKPSTYAPSTSNISYNVSQLPDSLASSRQSPFLHTGSELERRLDSSTEVTDSGKPRHFSLLMAITFWVTCCLYGPVSPVKGYVCFPTGNKSFLFGTMAANVFMLLPCLAATRCQARSRVKIVVALTSLATILLTYFVALIWFSHTVNSRGSPLFENAGELLTTIAWVAVIALFYFAKVSISIVCRSAGMDAVVWFSCVTQLGVAVGSLILIDNVSICKVFRSYNDPCAG